MIYLTLIKNILNFRGYDYNFLNFNYVDEQNFEVITNENTFNFIYGETSINGIIPNNWEELNKIS